MIKINKDNITLSINDIEYYEDICDDIIELHGVKLENVKIDDLKKLENLTFINGFDLEFNYEILTISKNIYNDDYIFLITLF